MNAWPAVRARGADDAAALPLLGLVCSIAAQGVPRGAGGAVVAARADVLRRGAGDLARRAVEAGGAGTGGGRQAGGGTVLAGVTRQAGREVGARQRGVGGRGPREERKGLCGRSLHPPTRRGVWQGPPNKDQRANGKKNMEYA